MNDISVQTWKPLADGEYNCVHNYVVLDGDKLIAGYKGGTLAVVLPDNMRLCVLEIDAAPGPDWSHAPAWAAWHTIDCNGTGYWHEGEPGRGVMGWGSARMHGDRGYNIPLGIDWRLLKQKRPETEPTP